MRKPDSFYLPQLDGLRFFAFLSVFIWHFNLMSGWTSEFVASPQHSDLAKTAVRGLVVGTYGVDLFFTLSAYLITELLLRERRTCGSIAAQSFYVRRALRIWPLYYGALVLILVCSSLLPSLAATRNYLPWFFLFAGNFAICQWGPTVMLLSPLWSVSVEEQFYFLWPITIRRLSRRRIIQVAIILWAIGIAFRFSMLGAPNYKFIFAYNTLARVDPIAAGILIAAVLNGRVDIKSRIRPSTFAIAGMILWVMGFCAELPWGPATMDHYRPLAGTIVALGSAAFLIAALRSGANGSLSARPLVYLGRISYGLYVFHGAVILAGGAIFGFPEGISRWCLMAAELAVTIAIAAASYRWVEQPFLRLKRRFQRVASGAVVDRPSSDDTDGAVSAAPTRPASFAG